MEIRRLKPVTTMRFARQIGAAPVRRPTRTIRPLEHRDLARVAELHARVMSKANGAPNVVGREQLARILLQHPWHADGVSSLVCEENDGAIIGSIGVMSRPMVFQSRPLTAAISHSFMVEPGSRSGLAALQLAKKFISGPQDLSLAEGGDASRRIWEAAGGEVSLLYGLCWTRPLAPSRYVLSFLRKRGLSPAVAWGLRPVCRRIDALLPLAAGRSLRLPAPPAADGTLDVRTFVDSAAALTRERSLRPAYDEDSASWLFETLGLKKGRGRLEKAVVRNGARETIGWYLYYGSPGEIGAVVQIGARAGCAEDVLDHLFHHARRRGLIALSGQADPALFHALAKKDCLFHHDGGSSMLIHSKYPEVLHAIHRGDACLTRLDGEWWISFLLG